MRHHYVPRALLCCSQYCPWPKEMSLPGNSLYAGIKPGWIRALLGYVEGEGRGMKDHCMGIGKGMVPFFER